jgi:hypothetical protein
MYLQKVISKKIIFCWRLEGYWRKEQDPELDPNQDPLVIYGSADPDLDPYQNVTDPEHCL